MRVSFLGRSRAITTFGAAVLGCGLLSAGIVPGVAAGASPASTHAKVLLVGSYKGKAGKYKTIQAAVNAARPGDFILVGPGDYHETADETGPHGNPAVGAMGGVYITKSGITLRGMNRGSVIVDGTKAGAKPCSSAPGEQNYGAAGKNGKAVGRNGILVWKASDVSVENMTVCNFLAGTGASGNQVWWNGGDGSGKIGLHGYWASYVTTTSTFFSTETTAAEYGIFSSNSAGPAVWNQVYGSNMNDSGSYVGACHRACDVVMDHMWMENNALGYSGTNSGGKVVIENSQFDHNQDGLDTNTAVVGDPPAPQDGRCGRRSTITHTISCWVVMHNYIHDNNNPTAPAAGSAAAGPVGTGMTVSGGRYDTVMDNRVVNNGAWGVLFLPYAQSGKPSLHQTCKGAGGNEIKPFGCVLDPESDALLHNTFRHNGYFGNPSNSDYGQITLSGHEPQNCYAGNKAPDGSWPGNLEKTEPASKCGLKTKASRPGGQLLLQVLCDTGLSSCPPHAKYPKPNGTVVLRPLPHGLPTMPNPCAGVPANAWCPGGHPWSGTRHARQHAASAASWLAGRRPELGRLAD